MTQEITASPRWIDTHCHLQLGEDGDLLRDRAFAAGVEKMVCVGTDAETSRQALEVAKRAGRNVFATVGLHPHDAIQGVDGIIAILDLALQQYREFIVGIGECGLDYYYEHSPRDIQRQVFANQIALAKENDLTLVIHTRDAWDDTFEILRSEGVPPRTVVHCYTGGVEEARTCLELGLYLSFSGIVTFKKSDDIKAAAEFCPVDRLLIETDSPFLAPVPFRGKPNEPANVGRIGEFLSTLKNMQVGEFSEVVSRTSEQVFSLQ